YLAEAVYGDPALRLMKDLDLVVRPAGLRTAHRVLTGMGYAPHDEYGELETMLDGRLAIGSPSWQHQVVRSLHLPSYLKPGAKRVEIHWSVDVLGRAPRSRELVSPFRIDMERAWARSEEVRLGGAPVRALALDDLLLHLATHAAFNHCFNVSLKSVCDFAWLLRRRGGEVDWDRLAAAARGQRADRFLLAALWLARDLLGAEAPLERMDPDGSLERDADALRAARRHVLRGAPRHSPEWQATRAPILRWVVEVSGYAGSD
ncbi:MAG TPA: nucleotidyltransferase family protein, partial [Longimicrobiaceae bacterium]|nr:nucleotidyltransferase family protein [Longimicrobiaceae bacterium]